MDIVRFQWNVPPAGKLVIVNPDHNPYHCNLAPTGALMGVYHQTIDNMVSLPCGSTIRFLLVDHDRYWRDHRLLECESDILQLYEIRDLIIGVFMLFTSQTSFTLSDTRGSAKLCFPFYVLIDIILIQRLQECNLEFTANRNRCLRNQHYWNPR